MERSLKLSRRFYLFSVLGVALLVAIVIGVVVVLQNLTGHVRRMTVNQIYSEVEKNVKKTLE